MSDIGAFICGQCGARFHSMKDLNVHLERYHPEAYASIMTPGMKGIIQAQMPSNHELLLHFGVEELASPGVVLDEARAKATPCSCFTYKGKDLCWSKGIIGMLAQPQQDIYCVAGKTYKTQPALTRRYETFAAAAEEAHKKIEAMPSGVERLEVWLSAMGEELSKRGIEV